MTPKFLVPLDRIYFLLYTFVKKKGGRVLISDETLRSDLGLLRRILDSVLKEGLSKEELWNELQAIHTILTADAPYVKAEMDRIGGPEPPALAYDVDLDKSVLLANHPEMRDRLKGLLRQRPS